MLNLRLLIPGLLLAVLSAVNSHAGPAQQCGDGAVLFEDNFQAPDVSWQLMSDPTRSVAETGVTWTIEPNSSLTLLNESAFYEDFDLCVDVSMTFPEGANGYVGLAFWGLDRQNAYTFTLFPPKGTFGVYRVQNNRLLTPVAPQSHPAIVKESGAVNHLRVTGRGKQAALWVNGEKVLEMKGMPPAGGGKVGLDLGTSSKDTGPSKLTFANFQVRELPTQ